MTFGPARRVSFLFSPAVQETLNGYRLGDSSGITAHSAYGIGTSLPDP